jgi:hypothetical protein
LSSSGGESTGVFQETQTLKEEGKRRVLRLVLKNCAKRAQFQYTIVRLYMLFDAVRWFRSLHT